ncbi:hypothetical protein [Posidoniimonas polymericola]|uniref:hypothetical protein n=1 Tax=Posidoniimonas polymericola TaxID=2528002 RepID=UPI0011B381B5|nr:hypothetical protein [Posidoniimonas polymericola]
MAVLLLGVALVFRLRWGTPWGDAGWPRPFPYPDSALDALHDWWDKRNPPPPGSFKYHGEYYTILLFLDLTVVSVSALLGVTLGVVLPLKRFMKGTGQEAGEAPCAVASD